MALQDDFEQAAKDVTELPEKPNNDTLLKLYSLYKQSKDGDVSGKRPGMMDLAGRKKYDSWAKLKGTNSEDAMQQYVDLVNELKG